MPFAAICAKKALSTALICALGVSSLCASLTFSVAGSDVAYASPSDTGTPINATERSLTSDQIIASGEFPASYYLTNIGEVSSVKTQSPWGDCWAFAVVSALESSILKAQNSIDDISTVSMEHPQLLNFTDTVDLSERAIAWFAHETQTEQSAPNQAGEGYSLKSSAGKFDQLSEGNFKMIGSLLTAEQALISEEIVPYEYNNYNADPPFYSLGTYDGASDDARMKDWSVDGTLRCENDTGWTVTNAYRLEAPSVTRTDSATGLTTYSGYDDNATQAIKYALMNVGGVAIALDSETSIPNEISQGNFATTEPSKHFTYSSWSQYNAKSVVDYNHAVTIVGWDDTYSAANFNGTESKSPPADGAWLCKNNWGSDALYNTLGAQDSATHWGIRADSATGLASSDTAAENTEASGFFWLSYYDHSIQDPTVFSVEAESNAHNKVYQYDYMGSAEYTKPSTYTNDVWVANVFSAESTELLNALGVETFGTNETVDVEIYATSADGVDVDIMDDMSLLASASTTFANAGFHTVELSKPILITEGQRFVVAIKTTTVDKTGVTSCYLSLEVAYKEALAGEGHPVEGHVICNPGETFISINPNEWIAIDKGSDSFQKWMSSGEYSDVDLGNALVKAYTDQTTMNAREQIYITKQLV